jgi:hypothetical protein
MFGIDQQVQQTADAYRGKPQMLQQKYAQNQQLIDLLALQKLKSDKEEASRQMALSMGSQGKPPTIADQRESQVLDMTKKEVIDEQAGVMQNKMKQMQDAQKRVLQSAGAPPMPGQSSPQPQQPPSAGLAGLPAPNIQGMAGGGIVAFRTGDTVEGDAGEAEARRYMEEQRQRQRQPQAQQQAAPRGGMQAGLDALLAIRPEEIYEQRRIAAARDTNFTPEERAGKERMIQERSAADREAAFINGLLGMSGRTTNAGAIAAGGAAAQNTRNQALAARQRAEGELIDIGPASRAAGLKAGETAYGHAMPGLVSGVKAGVDLAQTGEMAATRADAAAARLAEMGEKRRADVLTRVEALVTNDPYYKSIVTAMEMPERLAAMEPTPKNIAARDRLRTEKSALYNQLFQDKLRHHLSDAGNAGTAPPVTTPAPPVQSQSSGQRPPPPPGFNVTP